MLEVQHISKQFGKTCVLNDISFSVERGEIYGLIGYNGVGKTTLMKIISGIYRADEGQVLIDGVSVYENPQNKKQCFFMTEEATFFAQSSLMQMRRFYRGYFEHWSDSTFYGLTDLFGVNPDMKISRFSKGMQRQASLILAFSTRSSYLFLDEAFDGLDITMRKLMKEMLKYYVRTQDALVLVSSHNLKELEDLADHIGMLSEGKLVFDDSTQHMREQFCTCQFRGNFEPDKLEELKAKLLEWDGENYECILESSVSDAKIRLNEIGATDIRVHPIRLEEFFRTERKEKHIDWDEIFA
jgi:ABC-2 type transport system ATP-binding protein